MSSKPAAAVLWGKLAWHPAVVAWRGLAQDPPDPEHIEVLRQGKKSATYRPDGGPRRYLDHLRVGRRTIHAHVANPALGAADVTALQLLVADLDRVERGWADVERACMGVPASLVHGDFQRKNTYIRTGATGPELFAIAWETAGWGVPAVDLTRIDLPTYWSVVRPSWPAVQLEDVRRLAAAGRIFLQLAGIRWVSPELAYNTAPYLRRPMSWLRVFHGRLTDAILELGGLR